MFHNLNNTMQKLITIVFTLFAFTSITLAQDVDEILGNYFDNIGGVEAWKELSTLKMTGKTSMNGQEFPMVVYSKRPNLQKVVVDVQGMELIPSCYDGEVGWAVNPFQGNTDPIKLDEETTSELKKQMFEDEFIDYASKGHTVELLGKEEIDGAETFKIRLTKESGDEMIYFFDSENFVPIMIKSFANAGPMKGQAVETYLSDYQEVGSVVIPMSMEQKVNGTTFMLGTMENIELNPELEESVFKYPGGQ